MNISSTQHRWWLNLLHQLWGKNPINEQCFISPCLVVWYRGWQTTQLNGGLWSSNIRIHINSSGFHGIFRTGDPGTLLKFLPLKSQVRDLKNLTIEKSWFVCLHVPKKYILRVPSSTKWDDCCHPRIRSSEKPGLINLPGWLDKGLYQFYGDYADYE